MAYFDRLQRLDPREARREPEHDRFRARDLRHRVAASALRRRL